MASDTLTIKIVTPRGTALEESASFVKFHAENGEIGVIPDHAPLLAKIAPGEVIIRGEENEDAHYFITSGLAEVQGDRVTLMVPFLEIGKDMDIDRVKSAEKRALDRLESPTADTDLSRAKSSLTRARARLYLHELIQKASKNR